MCGIFNTRNIICAMNVQVLNKLTFYILLVAGSFDELLYPDSNKAPTQTHAQRRCKLASIIKNAKKNVGEYSRWKVVTLFHIGASSSYRDMAYIVPFIGVLADQRLGKSVYHICNNKLQIACFTGKKKKKNAVSKCHFLGPHLFPDALWADV